MNDITSVKREKRNVFVTEHFSVFTWGQSRYDFLSELLQGSSGLRNQALLQPPYIEHEHYYFIHYKSQKDSLATLLGIPRSEYLTSQSHGSNSVL